MSISEMSGHRSGAVFSSLAVGLFLATAGWFAKELKAVNDEASAADQTVLNQADALFRGSIDHERRLLLSEVRVLIDDARIRTTLATPGIDVSTIEDLLRDLQESSGASILAIVEPSGTVRAVVGQDSLRGVDLKSSSILKSAAGEEAADSIWSFSDRMLVVAVAPIRFGEDLRAYLLIGTEPSDALLHEVARPLGVQAAVMIGDQVTAATTKDPDLRTLFASVTAFAPDETRAVAGESKRFARLSRLEPTGRCSVVWLTLGRPKIDLFGAVTLMLAMPLGIMLIATGSIMWLATRSSR
jgi:hypothetical protein